MIAYDLYREQKFFLRAMLRDMEKLDQSARAGTFFSKYSQAIKSQYRIMLYTILESVVVQSFQDIFDNIIEDKIHFFKTSRQIQCFYIKAKTKNKERDFNQIVSDQNFIDILNQFQDDKHILSVNFKKDFQRENPLNAGSLDCEEIQKKLNKLGIDTKNELKDQINSLSARFRLNLREEVKKNTEARNILAHGEKTFYEYGRDVDINDLKHAYLATNLFLFIYLRKIKNYISSKGYVKNDKNEN